MPFGKAAALLACFTQTRVSESTAQRHTEAVGPAYDAVQRVERERIERDWPEVPAGPDKLVVSADGAMVSGRKSRPWSSVPWARPASETTTETCPRTSCRISHA